MSQKTKFDINTQLILAQLHNLYKFQGRYGLYDLVYDFLMSQNYDLGFTNEQKASIWSAAQFKITSEKPHWMSSMDKSQLTAELHKYYKSMLAAEYLLTVEKNTNQRLNLTDENDFKIQLLTFTTEDEEN